VGVQPKRPTAKGPADWFTGDVWIDSIVQPSARFTRTSRPVPLNKVRAER
jgi:hypothetical protein